MCNLLCTVLIVYFVEVILFEVCASSNRICEFQTADGADQPSRFISFNEDHFSCDKCPTKPRIKTLHSKGAFNEKEVCGCNGVLCSHRNQCIRAEMLQPFANAVRICSGGKQ